MNSLLKKLTPGIRAKLSLFTAFFVVAIVGIISALYLKQQYDSLTNSLEREITPLIKYSEKIVLDLENISFTFLLIEDFRYRLKQKTQEVRKYKKVSVQVVEEKSWFKKNVLGQLNKIQEGLVDTRDIQKVNVSNTFFSEYITEKKLSEIEENVRYMLRDSNGNTISKDKFKEFQTIAFQANQLKRNMEELDSEISSLDTQLKPEEKNEKENQTIINKNKAIQKKISAVQLKIANIANKHEKQISELNQSISNFLYTTQKENIKELDLNTNLIRIQSYNTKDSKVNFDTNIFSDSNYLNTSSFVENPILGKQLENKLKNMKIEEFLLSQHKPHEVLIDNKEYEIWIKPILKKPQIVQRALLIKKESRNQDSEWNQLIQEDSRIANEFRSLTLKLSQRIKILRQKKLAPYTDGEYVKLYREYNQLLVKRENVFSKYSKNKEAKVNNVEELLSQEKLLAEESKRLNTDLSALSKQIKEKSESDELFKLETKYTSNQRRLDDVNTELKRIQSKMEDWTDTESLYIPDAFFYLRDAALYEHGILRFKYNVNSYRSYLESNWERKINKEKWKAVRKWITEARSETKLPDIHYEKKKIDVFDGGVLTRSRSEMEEEMWRLDSTPLFQDTGKGYGICDELLIYNTAGFTRTIVDKSIGLSKIKKDMELIIYNSTVIGFSAIILAFLFSSMMVNNIRKLSLKAEEVGKGNLQISFSVKSRDEIGKLSETLNAMVSGLIERDKVKNALGRFVNPQIAEMVLKNELKLGGVKKECVIFFSDIRGFTSISEKLTPEEVVEFLNEYMSVMVNCVNVTHGIVDKFIGDAIMATWGAAFSKGNDAENAVNSALMMREVLKKFNEGRGSEKKPIIKMGAGLNYGKVIAGQIGSEERLEYTVIGDAVNLASRVESLNKPFGTDILITDNLYQKVKDIFRVEKMQSIKVKGKAEPQTIYAVLGRMDDENSPQTLDALRRIYGIDQGTGKNIEEEEVKYTLLEK
jgi:class 3 adenylate cyclase